MGLCSLAELYLFAEHWPTRLSLTAFLGLRTAGAGRVFPGFRFRPRVQSSCFTSNLRWCERLPLKAVILFGLVSAFILSVVRLEHRLSGLCCLTKRTIGFLSEHPAISWVEILWRIVSICFVNSTFLIAGDLSTIRGLLRRTVQLTTLNLNFKLLLAGSANLVVK